MNQIITSRNLVEPTALRMHRNQHQPKTQN